MWLPASSPNFPNDISLFIEQLGGSPRWVWLGHKTHWRKSLLAAGVGLRPGYVSKYGYQNPKGLKHNNVANIACKIRNLVVTLYVSIPKLWGFWCTYSVGESDSVADAKPATSSWEISAGPPCSQLSLGVAVARVPSLWLYAVYILVYDVYFRCQLGG